MRKLNEITEQKLRKNKATAEDIASQIVMLFDKEYACKKLIRNILTQHYKMAGKIICHIGHYWGYHGNRDLLHRLDHHLSDKEIMALHASYHIARLGSHINAAKNMKDPYQDLFNRYQARKAHYCRS